MQPEWRIVELGERIKQLEIAVSALARAVKQLQEGAQPDDRPTQAHPE